MKRLTLLRHAKSNWDDATSRDFDRPLNPRGRRAARAVGREMRAQALAFDRIVASPAVRVIETLQEVADGFGAPLEADYDKRLYLASTAQLLEIVQDSPDGSERLLLVGHNPGIESLALLLSKAGTERQEIEVKYPTGALVEMVFDVERWADVDKDAGTITRLVLPRDLDPTLGPDADTF